MSNDSLSKNLSVSLAPDGILVNTVSPGSFLSAGMRSYLLSLPPERAVDPDSLEDAMRVIAEDFGHPAYLARAGRRQGQCQARTDQDQGRAAGGGAGPGAHPQLRRQNLGLKVKAPKPRRCRLAKGRLPAGAP